MIRFIYSFITNEKRVAFFRKCDGFLRKVGGRFYVKTLGQLKYILRFGKTSHSMTEEELEAGREDFCGSYEKTPIGGYAPLVSVLLCPDVDISGDVSFVGGQTYKNVEIFALDEGITRARGELLWIVQKDTICDADFLEKIVPLFCYQSVLLAFCAHGDMGKEREVLPFQYMTAHDLLTQSMTRHNQFPSLGGAVLRMGENLKAILKMHQLHKMSGGSWADLLCMKRGGVVGYTAETNSWHRESMDKEPCPNTLDIAQNKYPNVVMACYALRSGGGETFPIHLANALSKRGVRVTILNFDLEEHEDRIVDLIDGGIPVVNMRHTDVLGPVLHHLGEDIVHSHHATVDYALSMWLGNNPQVCRQLITLHGMYETITPEDCTRVIRTTQPVTRMYAYVADKNLDCFKERDLYREDQFVKMPNGLPQVEPCVLQRCDFGIGENDFVFVLASRGIPEKGWKEAIDALQLAQQDSGRKLQLIILGDGECRSSLEQNAPDNVHFMGTVSNVRDYFAFGDAGLLPTMYAGESYPLVVMECLMCGKPVIATDIGEVRNQLQDGEGHMAGMLLTLKQGKIEVTELAENMRKLVEQKAMYDQLQQHTKAASEKFDIGQVAEGYLQLYQRIMKV